MPAAPRLNQRQAAFAARTVSSSLPSTRQIASGSTPLAMRLGVAVGRESEEAKVPGGYRPKDRSFERMTAPRGLLFPGGISLPPVATSSEDKERRNAMAIETADRYQYDSNTFWTDRSVEGGACAAAIA